MTFFNSAKKFVEKTYKDNVSEDTREQINHEIKKKTDNAKNSINEFKSKYLKEIEEANKQKKETKESQKNNNENVVDKENDKNTSNDSQNKSNEQFYKKYEGVKSRIEQIFSSNKSFFKKEKLKELEKRKLISILHIREDDTKLIRIRGVPFVCILDEQSAKDSGKFVWKIGQKAFPYIVEMTIGKASTKKLITRIIYKGWSFYKSQRKRNHL